MSRDELLAIIKSEDYQAREELVKQPDLPIWAMELLATDWVESVRRALVERSDVPERVLIKLIKHERQKEALDRTVADEKEHFYEIQDNFSTVRDTIARRQDLSPRLLDVLTQDPWYHIQEIIAKKEELPEDVVRYLAVHGLGGAPSIIAARPELSLETKKLILHEGSGEVLASRKDLPPEYYVLLSFDEYFRVRRGFAKTTTDVNVMLRYAHDPDYYHVVLELASRPDLPEAVLKQLVQTAIDHFEHPPYLEPVMVRRLKRHYDLPAIMKSLGIPPHVIAVTMIPAYIYKVYGENADFIKARDPDVKHVHSKRWFGFTRKENKYRVPSLLACFVRPPMLTGAIKKGTIKNFIEEHFQDISPYEINRIGLRHNKLEGSFSQLEELALIPDLERLVILDNKLTDLDGIEQLKNLRSVAIRDNQLKDITALQSLSNLEYLYLDRNQITDIECLPKLKKLKVCHLDDNQVEDITPLSKCPNLEELFIAKNKIKTIKSLISCHSLKKLEISFNKIRDIPNLNELHQLEWLGYNEII